MNGSLSRRVVPRPWLGAEEPEPEAKATVRPGLLPLPGQPREPTAMSIRSTRTRSSSPTTSPPSDRSSGPARSTTACSVRRGSVVCVASSASRRRHDLTLGRMTSPERSTGHRPLGGTDRGPRRHTTVGSRYSRTAARRWVHPTRILTARSGRGRRCPTRRPRALAQRTTYGIDWAPPPPRLCRARSGGPASWSTERRVAGGRPVLGRLAIRDAGGPQAACEPAIRAGRRRTR